MSATGEILPAWVVDMLEKEVAALTRHAADATSSPDGLICAVCCRRVTQVHHKGGRISFRHWPRP